MKKGGRPGDAEDLGFGHVGVDGRLATRRIEVLLETLHVEPRPAQSRSDKRTALPVRNQSSSNLDADLDGVWFHRFHLGACGNDRHHLPTALACNVVGPVTCPRGAIPPTRGRQSTWPSGPDHLGADTPMHTYRSTAVVHIQGCPPRVRRVIVRTSVGAAANGSVTVCGGWRTYLESSSMVEDLEREVRS